MSDPIISVSGLRGIIGDSLTPDIAMRYASAFVQQLSPGPIVISRDGRATGRMLLRVVAGTLEAMGRHVIDADVAATPTTGILVRQNNAAGGLQISASHNPAPYNGIKLFGPQGRVISSGEGQKVLDCYHAATTDWVDHGGVGRTVRCDDSISEHMQRVLGIVDAEAIREARFNVLLDSNNGAGAVLGRPLLTQLGCHVTVMGEVPNGQFSHLPEPTAENLSDVRKHVGNAGAAVGFCQDPDADRLALIDEAGRYVGEEFTLAVCLKQILRKRKGPIVTNCSTSRMSQDLAAAAGVPFFRSKVGEANVADLMIQEGAVFGGEGNGGPIDPEVGYVRDSFVGMALVLDAMASRGMLLSQLVDELPQYAIHKTKVDLPLDQVSAAFEKIVRAFPDATADRLDGLRLDWQDGWLLVRASNTEPIVRVIAEASTLEAAVARCENACRAM